MAPVPDLPQDADLRIRILRALAGRAALIYGSEGWGFEPLRAPRPGRSASYALIADDVIFRAAELAPNAAIHSRSRLD